MEKKNSVWVNEAFTTLLPKIADFVGEELSTAFGEDWWVKVRSILSNNAQNLPESGSYQELVASLDLASCLQLINAPTNWEEVFRKRFPKNSKSFRAWINELHEIRNKTAHLGSADMEKDDADRALDTAARICEPLDPKTATEIRKLLRRFRYGEQEDEPTSNSFIQSSSLPSWREVILPRPDVAEGRYEKDEFAASLNMVALGEAPVEYQDPIEFFQRTYLTDGLVRLLAQAVKRVSGKAGNPVIQLKTAFGGGKTHSMLALFHLLRGASSTDDLPNIDKVLKEAGTSQVPKTNVAVIDANALDPSTMRRPSDLPGVTINTLWGEIVAQLVVNADKPKLYDLIKESDKQGIAPGSNKLREILDQCGPCVILIDELVAYGRQLYNPDNPKIKTRFECFTSFLQQITEAVKASKNSLLVASIPESEAELGGTGGEIVLKTIEKHFGRLESIWTPVEETDGFEVVRRRLFNECKRPAELDKICEAYSQMYSAHKDAFPIEAQESDYKERMKKCYPFHPEFFDRLYKDWTTLENFQRTRGILRLAADIVHELWVRADPNSAIMPSSIPLDSSEVKNELLHCLPSESVWRTILDAEIDGKSAVSVRQDKENQVFGQKSASKRMSRAIFMGSAPSARNPETQGNGARSKGVQGVKRQRLLLGVVTPNEQENISVFVDALTALRSASSYLYCNETDARYWYDTRPTLRRTMLERADKVCLRDVEDEIKKRIGKMCSASKKFAGVHVFPDSSGDVPDDGDVRVVVLGSQHSYSAGLKEKSPAFKDAESILNTRGDSPRVRQNSLVFVAPIDEQIKRVTMLTRQYLAWVSIKDDSVKFNLDESQKQEVDIHINRENKALSSRIAEAYRILLVPTVDLNEDNAKLGWNIYPLIVSSAEKLDACVEKTLSDNGELISVWNEMFLRQELEKYFWKNEASISIQRFWDYLTTYCYAPRLRNYRVLEDTIKKGVKSSVFAIASGCEDGRFLGLTLNNSFVQFNKSCLLVKVDVAKEQIEEDTKSEIKSTPPSECRTMGMTLPDDINDEESVASSLKTESASPSKTHPIETLSTYFEGSKNLDRIQAVKEASDIMNEIVTKFGDNCDVSVTLTIDAHCPEGFSHEVKRTILENCNVLNVDYTFREE